MHFCTFILFLDFFTCPPYLGWLSLQLNLAMSIAFQSFVVSNMIIGSSTIQILLHIARHSCCRVYEHEWMMNLIRPRLRYSNRNNFTNCDNNNIVSCLLHSILCKESVANIQHQHAIFRTLFSKTIEVSTHFWHMPSCVCTLLSLKKKAFAQTR